MTVRNTRSNKQHKSKCNPRTITQCSTGKKKSHTHTHMPLHRKTEDAISSKGEEEKGPFAIPPQVMLYVVEKKKNGKNFCRSPLCPVQSSPVQAFLPCLLPRALRSYIPSTPSNNQAQCKNPNHFRTTSIKPLFLFRHTNIHSQSSHHNDTASGGGAHAANPLLQNCMFSSRWQPAFP